MQVDIPQNTTGEVGFLNKGDSGNPKISLQSWCSLGWWEWTSAQTYYASFYVLANSLSDAQNLTGINVSLRSNLTENV